MRRYPARNRNMFLFRTIRLAFPQGKMPVSDHAWVVAHLLTGLVP